MPVARTTSGYYQDCRSYEVCRPNLYLRKSSRNTSTVAPTKGRICTCTQRDTCM